MNIFALSALTAGIVALVFGGLVILKDSRKKNNRIFFLMCLSVSTWGFSYWIWLANTTNPTEALFWIKILTAGSLLTTLFFTHWVLIITQSKNFLRNFILTITYSIIFGFIIILAIQPNLLIGPIGEKLFFPLWPSAGPIYLYHIILAYFLPLLFATGIIIQRLVTTTNKIKKGQLISFLAGSFFGFIGGAFNFFLWFDIPIQPYGNFAVIAFPPIVGYSIIRYKLFTFRTLATELLVLVTVTIVFAQIFLSQSVANFIFQFIFFIAIATSSYLLLKSVYKGVETREKLEDLTKKLKHTNARLKELDRQKSEFLSIATHQLRGPLAGIRGHLSLLLDGSYGEISKKSKEIIQKVFNSSGLLAQTINDFLNVSRIEQGSMQYDKKEFKAGMLIADIVEELETLASDRGLKLTMENTCGKSDCVIYADYAKINHIFFNLIDNAVKYTEKGWVKIKISAIKSRKKIRVEVSDSGVGIDKDEINGLFEKFVRARGASGINVNGTGLGLYVAKQMVEAHNGKIWAESEGKGEGSTFVVELPAI